MKKTLMTIAFIFAAMIMFGQTNDAFNEITSMQPILLQVSEEVVTAETELNMEVVHLEADLLLGNDWKYMYRTLSKGWTYLAYTEGQIGMVDDMDLKVMKQNPITEEWYDVVTDTKENFGGIAVFEVTETARYAFGIKVAKYTSGWTGCHYFLLIGHAKPE